MTFSTLEECTQPDVPDDGYSAGAESEADVVTPVHSPERIAEDNTISNPEDDDYVESFDDHIGKDDFMSGREFDYGDFPVGIDDIDLDTSDFENNISLDIGETEVCPSPNVANLVTEDAAAAVDVNSSNGEEIHVSALGDCGCSNHAIAQEISANYQDGITRGFFKR